MIVKFFILLINFYKKNISPLFPRSCRFEPSCSTYAVEALHTHGAIKGTALSVWRILRCNPFCRGGYDPVPPKKEVEQHKKQPFNLKDGKI